MTIPFTKAHGARNDFLLTWRHSLPVENIDLEKTAQAICTRHTGVGADGWLLVSGKSENADGAIELWNSDGSRSEISGNGTRCAAAFLLDAGLANEDIRIATGAGVKHLRLLEHHGNNFSFEMNMGTPHIEELHATFEDRDGVILNVGNPQCAFFVDDFDFDRVAVGGRMERHPRFPNRTNVSFVRVVDSHTIDVRFFERGAGETMSSGTGSTGAAAAAVARKLIVPPVRVLTQAGPLDLRWGDTDIFLAGPAELIARGEFLLNQE